MNEYIYVTLRQKPELKEEAATWFHDKWEVPQEAYLECMEAYLNHETEYGWYLCLDSERIVGGLGVNPIYESKGELMKKISLFIAMSLDGYIADSKGSVEWLTGQGNDDDNIDAYSEFVKDIDTVIMGWNTFHQIVTELSPDEWIYDDFTSYVVTHKPKTSSDKIRFVNENPVELIKRLREENGKGIWICGGANLIQQLVQEDVIDCYYITVIPTILGFGIRLFEKADHEIKLKLVKTQSYNGMTDLIYIKR